MQNRSNRGSGKPVWVRAHQAREFDWDPIRRIALGPAVMETASTGRTHDCTRPTCINVKTNLANREPSTHDPTILSQCGTIFSLRLTNAIDRSHVRSAATDNLEGLFAMLPILRTGETIIVGESVNIPVRTLIDRPSANRRPDSEDPAVVVAGNEEEGYETPGGWNQRRDPSNYTEVVELWRRQDARSRRLHVESNEEAAEE